MKKIDEIPVVGFLFKSERSAVIQVGGELAWCTLAQNVDWSCHLFLRNS
jgi:hypothetical protein